MANSVEHDPTAPQKQSDLELQSGAKLKFTK